MITRGIGNLFQAGAGTTMEFSAVYFDFRQQFLSQTNNNTANPAIPNDQVGSPAKQKHGQTLL